MVQYIQLPRGDTATEDARIAPIGVITIDTEGKSARLHDGMTPGGHKIDATGNIPALQVQLFRDRVVWSGGNQLTAVALQGNLVELGAGSFILPNLTDLAVGAPVFFLTGFSAPTLNVWTGSANRIITPAGESLQSVALQARAITCFAKVTTNQFLRMSVET